MAEKITADTLNFANFKQYMIERPERSKNNLPAIAKECERLDAVYRVSDKVMTTPFSR